MNNQKDIYYLQSRENGFPKYTYYRDMGEGYDLIMDSDEINPYKEVKNLKVIKDHISDEIKNNRVDIYPDVLVKESFDNSSYYDLALPERGCIIETNNEYIITDSIDFYKNDIFRNVDKDINKFLKIEKRKNWKRHTNKGKIKPIIYGVALASSIALSPKIELDADVQNRAVTSIETEVNTEEKDIAPIVIEDELNDINIDDSAFMDIPEELKINIEKYENSSNQDTLPEPIVIDDTNNQVKEDEEPELEEDNYLNNDSKVYVTTQGVSVPYCSIVESEYYDTGVLRNISVSYDVDDVERKLIESIVASEDNGSYEGALAVMSTAINRMYDTEWKSYGDSILQQFRAISQYFGYQNGDYKVYFNGTKEIPSYVKQAVTDALNGVVNTSFCSFNSPRVKTDGVQIGKGGNMYFDPMNTFVEVTYNEDGTITQYDPYRDEYLGINKYKTR